MNAKILAILCLALLLPGCAGSLRDQSAAIDNWARQQGGCVCDGRLQRVVTVGNALAMHVGCSALQFHVLRSNSLSAFSWPSGDVFVTAGLVDHASDDEIAASIAHELGHLLSDGHLTSAVSLRGTNGPINAEQRADLIGCQLLQATGRCPEALVQALTKVCAAAKSTECRDDIRRRIAAIHQQFPS